MTVPAPRSLRHGVGPRRRGPLGAARPATAAAAYVATAMPGMPFSSPSSADETVTEKRSIDSGVSRLR